MASIIVDRGRTIALPLVFAPANVTTEDVMSGAANGDDVSADTFASQIRAERSVTSDLIAEWTVDATDAARGLIVLRLDDSVTGPIPTTTRLGYMDVKRTIGGEPTTAVSAMTVIFEGVETA
ncbi:MAG: hypothetical protein ABIO83_02410 [Ilumatobacteraceae bacterium]